MMRGRRQGHVVLKAGGERRGAWRPFTSCQVSAGVRSVQASVQAVFGKTFSGFGEGLRVCRLK